MRNKTYIAGPMTGLPNYNWDKFYTIESALENNGVKTANPARITDEMGGQGRFLSDESFRNEVIKEQQRIIANDCDSMYLLDGWEKSNGAREEVRIAIENGLKLILENEV